MGRITQFVNGFKFVYVQNSRWLGITLYRAVCCKRHWAFEVMFLSLWYYLIQHCCQSHDHRSSVLIGYQNEIKTIKHSTLQSCQLPLWDCLMELWARSCLASSFLLPTYLNTAVWLVKMKWCYVVPLWKHRSGGTLKRKQVHNLTKVPHLNSKDNLFLTQSKQFWCPNLIKLLNQCCFIMLTIHNLSYLKRLSILHWRPALLN